MGVCQMQPNGGDQHDDMAGPASTARPSPVEEAFRKSVLRRMDRIEEKLDRLLRDQDSGS